MVLDSSKQAPGLRKRHKHQVSLVEKMPNCRKVRSLTAICGELCTQVNSRERRDVTRPTEKKTLPGSWKGSAKSAD